MGKIRRRPVPEIEVEAEDLAADLFFHLLLRLLYEHAILVTTTGHTVTMFLLIKHYSAG